jgi:hypothetical protein
MVVPVCLELFARAPAHVWEGGSIWADSRAMSGRRRMGGSEVFGRHALLASLRCSREVGGYLAHISSRSHPPQVRRARNEPLGGVRKETASGLKGRLSG